jgi:phenylacetate-CoA ligase
MNALLLAGYNLLPVQARSAAATLRGMYLRSWRYGADTEALVAAAQERETWPAERWREWQEERLAELLHRAVTKVPYYRERWAERRRRGDRASWERLESWPVLEKEEVRRHPRAFVAEDVPERDLFPEHTSGTTGKPLELWWSRRAVREFYALFEARARLWSDVSRRDRWAILGGQLVVPASRTQPPFWVWNAALRQLYMSAYHIGPDTGPSYLDALRRHGIRYLFGYPSALHALGLQALAAGRTDLGITVAITNAEPLLQHQRDAIAAAFRCPVRETYGMAEIVAAASECPSGRLHLWPELGHLEFEGAGAPLDGRGRAGSPLELVATGLLNDAMPLVRYRVGDRATAASGTGACACGRTLPALAGVDGRADDVLYTVDGRAIGRLDPVFKSRLPLREAQIVQEGPAEFRVLYVPDPGFDGAAARLLASRLRERVGDVTITLERVERVPRDANGKFRSVVRRTPPHGGAGGGEPPGDARGI